MSVVLVEVVYVLKGIQWQGKVEYGNGEDVQNYLFNYFLFVMEDKDDGLQVVDCFEKDKGGNRDDGCFLGDYDDEVDDVGDCDRLDNGGY